MDTTNDAPTEPASPERKTNGRFMLWGVPVFRDDVRRIEKRLLEYYKADDRGRIHRAVNAIIERNELVVSRCSTLMSFSGVVIALFVFIASNPAMSSNSVAKWVFYCTMAVWVFFTVWLLLTLRHVLPPASKFGTDDDFRLIVRRYLKRMRAYNLTAVVTAICFISGFLSLGYASIMAHPPKDEVSKCMLHAADAAPAPLARPAPPRSFDSRKPNARSQLPSHRTQR